MRDVTEEKSRESAEYKRKIYGIEEDNGDVEEIPPMDRELTCGFYLRFAHKNFVPCKHCQEKLKSILETCDLTLGNREYDPPVELWRKHELVRSE